MPERYKLGISRNRLFEFDNCVSFFGELKESLDLPQLERALKMLCLKEPVITSAVEIDSGGEAYMLPGKSEPRLEIAEGDLKSFLDEKKNQGIDFSEKLFSFAILNEKILCIFAHTVAADVRSLMYLAKELVSFYSNKTLSVEPCEIKALSETSQMPSNVFSVVTDRLASGLEVGWQKKTAVFTCEDYKKACEKYQKSKSTVGELAIELDKEMIEGFRNTALEEEVDASSLVAYAFYEALSENLSGKRKYRKLNVQGNERVFFEDYENMSVGAYNGYFAVEKKKNKKMPDTLMGSAMAFHDEIYKRATSSFSTFYNEFLFMRLPPSFADSQYMFCAGEFKHKYSKKLAYTYGCANEVFGEFCSYNLAQSYWSGLEAFENISASEPLKMRASSLITFVRREGSGRVTFEYKKDKIPDSVAVRIVENATEILAKLTKI